MTQEQTAREFFDACETGVLPLGTCSKAFWSTPRDGIPIVFSRLDTAVWLGRQDQQYSCQPQSCFFRKRLTRSLELSMPQYTDLELNRTAIHDQKSYK